MFGPILYVCAVFYITKCAGQDKVLSQDRDFNKLKADPELTKHVSEILDRLKTFKIAVHPRVRIFYELLKISMNQYAQRTADSLYIPDKYNVAVNKKS